MEVIYSRGKAQQSGSGGTWCQHLMSATSSKCWHLVWSIEDLTVQRSESDEWWVWVCLYSNMFYSEFTRQLMLSSMKNLSRWKTCIFFFFLFQQAERLIKLMYIQYNVVFFKRHNEGECCPHGLGCWTFGILGIGALQCSAQAAQLECSWNAIRYSINHPFRRWILTLCYFTWNTAIKLREQSGELHTLTHKMCWLT